MTKVISGTFKGRELKVPKSVTRPTSSRVREAIFSATQHILGDLHGLRVLDLYAGSGASAIEAISRGASEAVAIEKDSQAVEVIKTNCLQLGIKNMRVVAMDVSNALHGSAQFKKFDLVFVDPPYSFSDQQITSELGLLTNDWLAGRAVVVIERSKRSTFEIPSSYVEIRRKVYGDTLVWYGQYQALKIKPEK